MLSFLCLSYFSDVTIKFLPVILEALRYRHLRLMVFHQLSCAVSISFACFSVCFRTKQTIKISRILSVVIYVGDLKEQNKIHGIKMRLCVQLIRVLVHTLTLTFSPTFLKLYFPFLHTYLGERHLRYSYAILYLSFFYNIFSWPVMTMFLWSFARRASLIELLTSTLEELLFYILV